MKKYNKLVRDKIPQIIIANGDTPHFRIITDDEEYLLSLFAKLREEAIELEQERNLDELADNLEVLYATARTLGYTPVQLEQARRKKHAKRGGFDKRIFLESA